MLNCNLFQRCWIPQYLDVQQVPVLCKYTVNFFLVFSLFYMLLLLLLFCSSNQHMNNEGYYCIFKNEMSGSDLNTPVLGNTS